MAAQAAEPLLKPATSCRLDENLKYLAELDVGSSQKAILLALITLAPKSSKQVEAALDRLESLIGLKRQTLRGHLRALAALGVLANLQINADRVRAELTHHVPEINTEPAETAATIPTPFRHEDETTLRPNADPPRTDPLHSQSTFDVKHEPTVQPPPLGSPLELSAPPRRRAGKQWRNPTHPILALAPGTTNRLTAMLAVTALLLLVYALTTGPRELTAQALGWGGLATVAASAHAARRWRDRAAIRAAHLGWASILAGSLHLLIGHVT